MSSFFADIDDTVKISNVLNKLKLAKATLFDEAEPVPGMPSLYASLQKSLDNPSFTYITGSPYQLGPFLRQFIKDEFASTPGPVLGKNLTLSLDRIGELADFLFDGENTKEFKLGQIQRVRNIWPSKKFLLVGDSGEKDSETYGEAYVYVYIYVPLT
jgi:phosphatidate phosphatase APP1